MGVNGASLPIGNKDDFFDPAAGTVKLSMAIGAKQQYGTGKPVIRGESGLPKQEQAHTLRYYWMTKKGSGYTTSYGDKLTGGMYTHLTGTQNR